MLDISLYILGTVFLYILIYVIRFRSLYATKTDKLIVFCRNNNVAIPEDSTLRRHFLTQLQFDLDCAR